MATITRRCLYFPDDSSPKQPVEERTLEFPPAIGFDDVVCDLLECPPRQWRSEMIFSDDQLAVLNGHEDGSPPLRPFTIYEAYMGHNTIPTRPLNSRAARLLSCPHSRGPIIVMKMTCTKGILGGIQEINNQPLTLPEIESSHFQHKRQEYAAKKMAHNEVVNDLFKGWNSDIIAGLEMD
ncbi:hypothetical protein BDN70DRAFT_931707 [Pholiota conissans]|uniref:Uncharacterized protein n=1 Tax=Pholiota conissans TaxID=109636 RepID=A0A9P5Z4C6_9AGAR|nr:hypothetical protein BDN70DRAFT_931707 [Pholiota conissans]